MTSSGVLTPPPVSQEAGGPSSSAQVKENEEAEETRATEVPETYMTYQRGTRRLFAADRQVFSPWDMEGNFPSSSTHRQMLAPQNVEGTLPSSSPQQVQQVQQLHRGKEKMLEESFDDEEEREFYLMEDDEPKQPHIHHGIEIVDLEAQDEAKNENITIRGKDAQIQALIDNVAIAKYVISYLEQDNKQPSDK